MNKVKYINLVDKKKLIEFLNKNKIEVTSDTLNQSTLSNDEQYIVVLSNGKMIALGDFDCQIFDGSKDITKSYLGLQQKYRLFMKENFKDNHNFDNDLMLFFEKLANDEIKRFSSQNKKHSMILRRIKDNGGSLQQVNLENKRYNEEVRKHGMILRRIDEEKRNIFSENLESQPQ